MQKGELPSGTATFLFAGSEVSAALRERHGDFKRMRDGLVRAASGGSPSAAVPTTRTSLAAS